MRLIIFPWIFPMSLPSKVHFLLPFAASSGKGGSQRQAIQCEGEEP